MVTTNGASDSKESACSAGVLSFISGSRRSLEKGITIHSSILAWRIPWTEEQVGYSPYGNKELDMTERLSLSQPKIKT